MKKKILIVLLSATFVSCSSAIRFSSENSNGSAKDIIGTKSGEQTFYGKASYYADKFHGRQTENGETFDQNKLTAAHKTLPFGTIVLVENLTNGKKVTVRINDRGPFVSGRIIDLSKKAAEEIDMVNDGVVDVKIAIINN